MSAEKVIIRRWHGANTLIAVFPQIPWDVAGLSCTYFEDSASGPADAASVIERSRAVDPKLPEARELLAKVLDRMPGCTLEIWTVVPPDSSLIRSQRAAEMRLQPKEPA